MTMMKLQKTLLALSAAALLVPIAARADPPSANDGDRDDVQRGDRGGRGWGDRDRWEHGRRWGDRGRWEQGRRWGDRGGDSGGQNGHYEQRTVSQWVDGHYDQVWMPEQCHRFGFWGRRVVCTPGHYMEQWVPGGYVQQQQWVWVPY